MKTATLILVLLLAASAVAADRPNILFIYTDDHSHRTIGCYPESYRFVKTPNIDQLAKDGIRFRYAYIGTWCMPSRATLLTGHYQHGVAVCNTPVGGVDLVPTFFELAGIESPWEMHGRSIMPLLRNPKQNWDRPLLVTFTGDHYGSDTDTVPTDPAVLTKIGKVPWYVSLHDGRFKYIRTFVEGETEELYDLNEDPEELTNLVSHSKHASRLAAMRAATIAELRRTKAGFVDNMPAVAK